MEGCDILIAASEMWIKKQQIIHNVIKLLQQIPRNKIYFFQNI